MPKKKLNKALVKSPLSTSIPAFYLHELERLVDESKGRETLASLVRAVLMDYVDKQGVRA